MASWQVLEFLHSPPLICCILNSFLVFFSLPLIFYFLFAKERKYKLDLVKRDCHFNNFVIIASIWEHQSNLEHYIYFGEQGMAQWWEHLPPTNVAQVQLLASTPYVGWFLMLVLSLALRGFSSGTPVFPSPQKPTLPNSNSIWNAWACLSEFIWTPRCFVGKTSNLI